MGKKAVIIIKTKENPPIRKVEEDLIENRLYWNFKDLKLYKNTSVPRHSMSGEDILKKVDVSILPSIKEVKMKLKTTTQLCLNKDLFRNYVEYTYFPKLKKKYKSVYAIKEANFDKIKDYLEFVAIELTSDKQLQDIDDLNFNELCNAMAECQDGQFGVFYNRALQLFLIFHWNLLLKDLLPKINMTCSRQLLRRLGKKIIKVSML